MAVNRHVRQLTHLMRELPAQPAGQSEHMSDMGLIAGLLSTAPSPEQPRRGTSGAREARDAYARPASLRNRLRHPKPTTNCDKPGSSGALRGDKISALRIYFPMSLLIDQLTS
jgi:hypothetical protein